MLSNEFNELKKIAFFVLFLLFVLTVFTYIANVLTIGEKIGNITCIGIEIAVDLLLVLGPIVVIFWQVHKYILKYTFACFDEVTNKDVSREKITKFLCVVKENYSQDEIPQNLQLALQSIAITDKIKYTQAYIEDCEKKSNVKGKKTAILASLSVSISSKQVTDTLCMLFWNYRIIGEVLKIYGVRPSGFALIKLYCHVLFSSLIIGSMEEVFDNFTIPNINIPFLGHVIQGGATLYTCLKTVKLTQYYLQHGLDSDKKTAIKEAKKYAKTNLFLVLQDIDFITDFKKTITQGRDIIKDNISSTIDLVIPPKKNSSTDVPVE